MLPWPANLFAQPHLNAAAPLLASSGKKKTDDHLCGCGCTIPHRNAVSRVVEEEQYGQRTRRIVWYMSLSCRNKAMGLSTAKHQATRL